jgi:hypothetical protein
MNIGLRLNFTTQIIQLQTFLISIPHEVRQNWKMKTCGRIPYSKNVEKNKIKNMWQVWIGPKLDF